MLMALQHETHFPYVPVGALKSFGIGPVYQVGRPLRQLENGDWMTEITLVESGEVTEYRLSQLLQDPDAV